MPKPLIANQSGQAVIEYVFVLAFMMVILVTFVRQYSASVGRSVQSLNYVLTHFLSTGNCPKACLTADGSYENHVDQ